LLLKKTPWVWHLAAETCRSLYLIWSVFYGLGGPGIESRWGEIFRPSRPALVPTQPRYNGYRFFPGVKYGRGVLLTTHPLLMPLSWKSRDIPLPTLWATTGPVTGTLYRYEVCCMSRSINLCTLLVQIWNNNKVAVLFAVTYKIRAHLQRKLTKPKYLFFYPVDTTLFTDKLLFTRNRYLFRLV
jgi:hypothetical protein